MILSGPLLNAGHLGPHDALELVTARVSIPQRDRTPPALFANSLYHSLGGISRHETTQSPSAVIYLLYLFPWASTSPIPGGRIVDALRTNPTLGRHAIHDDDESAGQVLAELPSDGLTEGYYTVHSAVHLHQTTVQIPVAANKGRPRMRPPSHKQNGILGHPMSPTALRQLPLPTILVRTRKVVPLLRRSV